MKIYIAGKITGKENFEQDFLKAAAMIRGYGYAPINPCEVCAHLPKGSSWEDYMAVCLKALLEADGIWLLPDWEDSRGARVEEKLAHERGLVKFEHTEMLLYDPFIHH